MKNKNLNEEGGNVDDFYTKKVYNHPNDDRQAGKGNAKDSKEDLDGDERTFISETDVEELQDKWYGIENDYRRQYPNLTDEDVEIDHGHFHQTLERIGRRRKRTSQEILEEIRNW